MAVAAAMAGKKSLIAVGTERRKKQVEDELSKYDYPQELIIVEVVCNPRPE